MINKIKLLVFLNLIVFPIYGQFNPQNDEKTKKFFPDLDEDKALALLNKCCKNDSIFLNENGAILYRKNTQDYTDNVKKKATTLKDSIGSIVLDSVRTSLAEVASIDLYKALKYINSEYDVILQDGDVIFVPEINPFVSVKGTVQSPVKLTFNKDTLKSIMKN